jgi:hypothetical protein
LKQEEKMKSKVSQFALAAILVAGSAAPALAQSVACGHAFFDGWAERIPARFADAHRRGARICGFGCRCILHGVS